MQIDLGCVRAGALTLLGLTCLAFTQLADAAAVTISGTPARAVVAGRTYSFTPAYRVDAGKRVTFSIVNKPSWANFNTGTGALQGTPASSKVGTYSRITISVSDGSTRATLPAFAVNVMSASSNHPPTITGTPPRQITAGQTYNFVPKATDVDGNALKFYVSSKPEWATFDSATGRLWGVPTTAQAGSYEEIKISVYDGGATAVLPLFAIDVSKPAPSSCDVTVSWLPPTENSDGSALTDLRGYKIRYGTQPGSYSKTVTVSNPGLTRYMIENVPHGRYYFTVVAYNSAGTESVPAPEKMIDVM